jgi:S1-C subfamily serine protease
MQRRVYLLTLAAAAAGGSFPHCGTAADSTRDAADRVRTKVIVLKTSQSGTRSAANGYLVRPGLMLTAGHTVAEADSITAWLNGVAYPARVAASHPEYDLAAVELSAPSLLLKPVELARTSEGLPPGEALLILTGPSQPAQAKGDPAERVPLPASFQQRVSLRDSAGRLGTMLKLSASVRRGDSGSPVVRVSDGTIVGTLCSRQAPEGDGVSRYAFAAPIEAVHRWLETIARKPAGEAEGEFYLLRLAR